MAALRPIIVYEMGVKRVQLRWTCKEVWRGLYGNRQTPVENVSSFRRSLKGGAK